MSGEGLAKGSLNRPAERFDPEGALEARHHAPAAVRGEQPRLGLHWCSHSTAGATARTRVLGGQGGRRERAAA